VPLPHPAELERLDLFVIWRDAAELGERFDPFDFRQRMAAYRELIRATNENGRFGSDDRDNPLWGLMFQHHWQWRSGRLGREAAATARIDPDAAWGYGNYALCVIPWLGAVAAGVVESRAIVPPPSASRFAYVVELDGLHGVPSELVAAVDDWRDYFALVRASAPIADHEPLRMALWKAHKTSLDVVADRLRSIDAQPLSAPELAFLRGWCRMVDYLWAAAWPTDFGSSLKYGLDGLPGRLLQDGDADLALTDLPRPTRRSVRNVVALARASRPRHGLNLWLWRRAMRTRAARDEVVPMLDAVFNPSPGNAAARRRLLRYTLGF